MATLTETQTEASVFEPKRKASLVPWRNRQKIYEYLFREGVIVVKKDYKLPKHDALEVSNLHVMLVLRSLKSKNYVTENYNWRYNYYCLNNDGMAFLREVLRVPINVHPLTVQQAKRPEEDRRGPGGGGRGYGRGQRRGFGSGGGFQE